jgi:hypothetical protein
MELTSLGSCIFEDLSPSLNQIQSKLYGIVANMFLLHRVPSALLEHVPVNDLKLEPQHNLSVPITIKSYHLSRYLLNCKQHL